jgi:hypothetical protein
MQVNGIARKGVSETISSCVIDECIQYSSKQVYLDLSNCKWDAKACCVELKFFFLLF